MTWRNNFEKKVVDADRATISLADLESHYGYAPFRENETTQVDTPVSIHIHSIRGRAVDPDGISAKACIDGLVHAGVLADDTAKQVKEVTFSQGKSGKTKTEYTVIDIYESE